MRTALGVSVLVLGFAAANAASARPTVDRPLAPMTHATHNSVKLTPGVGVRADLATSTQLDAFGDGTNGVRHRFASSMIDYYPLGEKSGVRVSAGLRFFQVQNFYGDAVRASRGLLWEPRIVGRTTGMHTGFERHTPAATIGYAKTIGKAVFGFEVGSLLGNANARVPRSFGTSVYTERGGLNPVANLNFALKF